VQIAVDTEHHVIVTHEVTNTGSDRSQLANIASRAKEVLGAEHLDAVADRGYFNSSEILACEQANITVTLPKPMTSVAKADGRFGKQDFVYLPAEDVYRCPAGEKLTYLIRTRRRAKCYAAIGRRRAPVRSNLGARREGNGALADGSTSTCSTPCSSVSMPIRRQCASVARPSSTPSRR
jgi:transposase